jgi:DNA repair exonuclease SbcCD ATPase subunit
MASLPYAEGDQTMRPSNSGSRQQRIRWLIRESSNQEHLILLAESRIKELEEYLSQAKEENEQFQRKQKEIIYSCSSNWEEARKNTRKGEWLPRRNKDIGDDLIFLQEDIEDWAAMCGLKSMPHLESLEDEEKIQLRNYVSKVARLPDEIMDLSSLMESSGKVPALLLGALLAYDIYSQILEDPFYFLDADAHMHSIQQGMLPSCVLKSVYDELIKGL